MNRTSELRNAISNAVDEIENDVGEVLDTLDDAECFATMETEDLEPWQIEKLKDAVIDAAKALKELKDKLW
jgi:hypothetical protein